MNSIMTNASAMTALQTLNMTNKALETTQARISTGYSVSSASDNAAYWSIATTMRSDNKSLSAVQDALGLGAAKADIAQTALESSIDVASEIKMKLVAAREPGVDRTKIQGEIKELQNQLKSTASAASFSGENWVSVKSDAAGFNATKSIVASFTGGAAVSIGTINIDVTKTKLFDATAVAADKGILDKTRTVGAVVAEQFVGTIDSLDISTLTNSATDLKKLENMITAVNSGVTEMTDAASALGSVNKRIDMQKDFVTNLMDAIDRGVGQLVDADMTKESSRLKALQTQQQLGIQSLSIANSSSQNVLSLFR
jgi:flagellin